MKTAISIPDTIFSRAEAVAKRLGISRSELYARAVNRFIESIQMEQVTERLNKLYSSESSSLEGNLERLQYKSLPKDEW